MAENMSSSSRCVLVTSGESMAAIVLAPDILADCRDAVQELVTGIAKSTGVRLYINGNAVFESVLEPVRAAPVSIHFCRVTPPESLDCSVPPRPLGEGPGVRVAAHRFGCGSADLSKDGFRIRVAESSVAFEAEGRAGFFNAVYAFLERYCGFRWLWPGPDGEVCDSLDRLEIPTGEITETPDYQWRHLLFADMPAQRNETENKWQIQEFHMRPSRSNTAEMRRWLRRNRMGGLNVVIGHTWGRFVNPDEFGREHPEYFAEIKGSREASMANFDGKHGGQICTSNPDVIDLLIRRVREHFDRFPEVDVISISPNDGIGFCECDACIARDVHYGNPPPQGWVPPDGELAAAFKDDVDSTVASARITGPITDRIFEFANRIAAGIAESHPDKKLLLLVYSLYRDPPRQVKLADNIIAQFCVSCHQHWDTSLRQADYDAIARLAEMTGETGIYEYFDQGAWPGLTRSFPDCIADSVRFFHQCGVRHYSTQASTGFAANGFNLWLLARVLWKTDVNVDALLDDYCRKAFGGAFEPMRRYFEHWRGRWRECRGLTTMGGGTPGSAGSGAPLMPFEQILKLYPSEFVEAVAVEIEAARAAVDPLSPERRRIDFCARALDGARIALAAASHSYDLRDRGWPMLAHQVTPAKVAALGATETVRATAREALRRWARWEACLEMARDDFVFSFFWVRYCYDSRRGQHPPMALRRILEILDMKTMKRELG